MSLDEKIVVMLFDKINIEQELEYLKGIVEWLKDLGYFGMKSRSAKKEIIFLIKDWLFRKASISKYNIFVSKVRQMSLLLRRYV